VMRLASGELGAKLIALGIAFSTLGFLSQSVLTAPRVYFAMGADGLFFKGVAYVSEKTHVPVVAIVLQSVWTIVIALTGGYEQILNFVIPIDALFFGLSACCLFVLRGRERRSTADTRPAPSRGFRTPGHPVTTIIFISVCWLVVANTVYKYPGNASIGILILLLGLPVYAYWHRRQKAAS